MGTFHSTKISGGEANGTDIFPEFHSEILGVPYKVGLKFWKNQNNQKILFQLTIPAYAQFCRAEKSNSTWLILKLLNITTRHDFYLTVDLPVNLLLQHYCTGLATTSFSNQCKNTCELCEMWLTACLVKVTLELPIFGRTKLSDSRKYLCIHRLTLNVVANSF